MTFTIPERNPELDSMCSLCRDRDDRMNPAVESVKHPDGTFRYYCEEHLRDLFRFDADPHQVAEKPLCVVCPNCRRLTLREDTALNRACADCEGEYDAISDEALVEIAEEVKNHPDPGGDTDETGKQS